MGKIKNRFKRVNNVAIHRFVMPLDSLVLPPTQHHETIVEFKKNIYNDYIYDSASTDGVDEYRQRYDIVVGGNVPAPNPIESFDLFRESPFKSSLLKAYSTPSPMLSQALPIILSGHDMIGLTRSGPERTVAYIIPAILHIHKQRKIQPNEGPIVVIVTQSLELGEKILQIASLFRGIRIALFADGCSPTFVRQSIEPGIEMVIACTETAKKLLRLNQMNLKFCSMLIFDDVDAQIFSDGEQVFSNILKYAAAGRQLLWFSEKWWEAAEKMASEHMPNGHCIVEVGRIHRDVHRICRQKVYILNKPENRMQFTSYLIRKIQSTSCAKILVFVSSIEDGIDLVRHLRTVGKMFTAVSLNGTSEIKQGRIESFRNGNINCLITIDSNAGACMGEGVEHVIHFAYNKANYGMRLSHMSYATTGGTSYVILYDTEKDVARSVVENLNYGNQEICAELLEILNQKADSTEDVQVIEDNPIPTIVISDDDESDTETLKVKPITPNKFAAIKKFGNNNTRDSYYKKIANHHAKDNYSRKENQSIHRKFRAGAIKRTQSIKGLMPLIPKAKMQKPESTDKWSGADVILERILIEEESMKKALSINASVKPNLPVHGSIATSTGFPLSSGNCISTNYTPATAYNIPLSSANLQSMNLPFRASAMSTNSHMAGSANPQMIRNNDTSLWNNGRNYNISTVNQSQFMNYGTLLSARQFSGNNMNFDNGQMIYHRRSNQ